MLNSCEILVTSFVLPYHWLSTNAYAGDAAYPEVPYTGAGGEQALAGESYPLQPLVPEHRWLVRAGEELLPILCALSDVARSALPEGQGCEEYGSAPCSLPWGSYYSPAYCLKVARCNSSFSLPGEWWLQVSFYPCVRIYMIRILQNACSKLGVLHLPSFKDPQRPASDGPKQYDSKNRVDPDTPGSRYHLSGSHVPFMGWSNPETSKTKANYDSSTSNAKETQGMTFWTSKCFIMFPQKSCKSHTLFSSKILGNPSMLIPLGPQAGDGIDPLEEQRHLSGERQKIG